jgi:hypothetical protein
VVDVQLSLGKTRDEALGDRHARQSPTFFFISSANSRKGRKFDVEEATQVSKAPQRSEI